MYPNEYRDIIILPKIMRKVFNILMKFLFKYEHCLLFLYNFSDMFIPICTHCREMGIRVRG